MEPPFVRAVAYGSYQGALREMIHLLKYGQVRPAALVLGRMLGELIQGLFTEFGDPLPLLIPVPLHASKLRQRGFNQSELIAREALKTARVAGIELNTSALVRIRPTESQTGLTRHQRRMNLRGAFQVAHPAEISGRDILLVDDVYTTGTTASECARVLRRARSGKVWVATVARVLRPEAAFAEPPEQQDSSALPPGGMAAHA